MDIQKEREAFEEAMLRMTDGSFNTTKNHLTGQYTFGVNQTFWAVWQAAKAQAVPEGFVLVSKEPTEEMVEAGMGNFDFPLDNGRFYNHDLIFAYRAMLEAQESK